MSEADLREYNSDQKSVLAVFVVSLILAPFMLLFIMAFGKIPFLDLQRVLQDPVVFILSSGLFAGDLTFLAFISKKKGDAKREGRAGSW